MTKFSVAVKYLSTVHPDFRDGLLKSNIEALEEGESIFFNSPHNYYENRPDESNEIEVEYDEEEKKDGYWKNISLSEFWSKYDIVYQKQPKMTDSLISLKDGSFIRRRNENAVLRRRESEEIHCKDVKELLNDNREVVEKIELSLKSIK